MRGQGILAAAALACALVAVPTGATASSERTLQAKTIKVRPSGKRAKFVLSAKGTHAYLTMSVKKGKSYRRLARIAVGQKFPKKAKARPIRLDQEGAAYMDDGGQGLIAWDAPDSEYTIYFGWNIATKTLTWFY